MSQSRRFTVAIVVALAVVGLNACSKAPQAAVDQAQNALEAAAEAGAPNYAPDAWEAAQEATNLAMAEVEVQNEKFVLTRSYKDASQMLATAQEAAMTAQEAAVAGKEAMAVAVVDDIASIEANLANADGLLAALATCRKRPKGFARDLEMMRGNVDGLRSQLVDVEATADAGDYFEANAMANGLLEGLDAVVSDMENAKAKLGC